MKKTLLLSVLISALALSVFADRGGGRGGGGRGGSFRGGDGAGRFDRGGGERFDDRGGRAVDRDGDFRGRDGDFRGRDGNWHDNDSGINGWGAFAAGLGLGALAGNFYPYHLYHNDYASGWTYTTTPYDNYTVYTWTNPNYGSSSYYQDVNGDVYVWDPVLGKWIKVNDPAGIIPNH